MAQNSRRPATRILIAAKYFSEGYGGTPESIRLLARNMASIGVACDVISPKRFIRDLHLMPALPTMRDAATQIPTVDIRNYAGLFVAGPWNFQAVGLARMARRASVPVCYAPKGGLGRADFSRLRDIKKILYFFGIEIFLLWHAKVILFSSSAERDNCVVPGILWNRKQTILPEPFSPPPLTAAPKLSPRLPVLGFMAEIRSLKGLRELVEAIAVLDEQGEAGEMRLRIAGVARPGSQNYLAKIHDFARRRGLSGRLEWVGEVRGDQNRSDFYESLDIFVCPSKSESFGLTPLEALWHGVPVAMGANIGVRSYIPANAPVAVFDAITPNGIASTLRQIVSRRGTLRAEAADWRGRSMPALVGDTLASSFLQIFRPTETVNVDSLQVHP